MKGAVFFPPLDLSQRGSQHCDHSSGVEVSPPLCRLLQLPTHLLAEYVDSVFDKEVIEECRNLRFQVKLFSVLRMDSEETRVILDLSQL